VSPGDALTPEAGPSFAVLPGAGSAGEAWTQVVRELDALLLPIGDEPDVASMAEALIPAIEPLARPRVILGASLGAMVAVEIARRTPLDALVLIAAGFGITVGDRLLDWVTSNPPDLVEKMARAGLAKPEDPRLVAIRHRDFLARGQPVLLAHLRALAAYRPQPLPEPPPTVVLWGEHDRGVPLEDHAALALAMRGVLVPIAGAGHAPFLEQPVQTVRWARAALGYGRGRRLLPTS
jgi:pimeloyl-ACP methyl ester carboxylesterase